MPYDLVGSQLPHWFTLRKMVVLHYNYYQSCSKIAQCFYRGIHKIYARFKMAAKIGLEPITYGLTDHCSTIELLGSTHNTY